MNDDLYFDEPDTACQATALDQAEATVRVLLPIWRTLTPPTQAQLADALDFIARFLATPAKPMARTEPDLPMERLERLRDLHVRGNG